MKYFKTYSNVEQFSIYQEKLVVLSEHEFVFNDRKNEETKEIVEKCNRISFINEGSKIIFLDSRNRPYLFNIEKRNSKLFHLRTKVSLLLLVDISNFTIESLEQKVLLI